MDLPAVQNTSIHQNFIGTVKRLRRQVSVQLMVIPGIIWMLVFCYVPMYWITIAFRQYNIAKPISKAKWVGFDHFTDFFTDEKFLNVMYNTLGISFFKLVIGFPLPILFAILLNELRMVRFKKIVQTISYLPHFLSWVVLGGIVITWLSDTGMLTGLMVQAGLIPEPVAFLGEPKYFWVIAIVSDIWKELGWSAIIYLAAIAGVEQELYEAAIVDGAGRFRRIWSITLPCIKGTVAILLILSVSGILNTNFDQILVLKNPLNANASDVIDIYVFRTGIQMGRFSYATAVGLFKSVISLALLLLANGASKRLNGHSIF